VAIGQAGQRRMKVSDQVIEDLRTAIVSGGLPPGSKLPNERDLATEMGVSQPTVREAVRALTTLGLIEVRHGSGAYVSSDARASIANVLSVLVQLERVRIIDVLEIRQALGIYSIQRAVEHATDEEIENIAELSVAMVEADTVEGLAEATIAFQVGLAAAAHHPLLFAIECFIFELLMKFQYEVYRERSVTFWRKRAIVMTSHRDNVLAALRARNAGKAAKVMQVYQEQLRERWSKEPDLAKVELSDPSAIRTLSQIAIRIPDVRAVSD
jgi:GntR family transcriptional repressor for pyruvate dehydrogenase complex